MTKPLEELVSIVKFIRENQPNELKDFLSKAPCENKMQYEDYVRFMDAQRVSETIDHSYINKISEQLEAYKLTICIPTNFRRWD